MIKIYRKGSFNSNLSHGHNQRQVLELFMANTPAPRPTIPCIAEVDVLVIGSTAAAVSAALSSEKKGAKVYLVSDRSYVGEELTAWLGEFPAQPDLGSVLSHVFQEAGTDPTPLSIKRLLEQSLMKKEIPFLFNCRPIALLNNAEGTVSGVAFAARSAWFVIRARHVVDASLNALAARLGPWKSTSRQSLQAGFSSLVHANKGGRKVILREEGKEPAVFEVNTSVSDFKCGKVTVSDLAAAEQKIREATFSPHRVKSSDSLCLVAPWHFEEIPASSGISIAGTAALDDITFNFRDVFALAEFSGTASAGLAAGRAQAITVNWAKPSTENISQGPTPLRWKNSCPTIPLIPPSFEILDEVDVLVVGGGTAGASAAIGAARSGARTLLIETLPGLGGVGTMGLIGRYWFGNRVGFTAEIDQGAAGMGPAEMAAKFTGGWNPEWKMAWYLKELGKAGGTVWFGSSAFGVTLDNNRVTGVLVTTPFGCGLVKTKTVIDATGNADIPAAAGAPCRTIGADHVAVQGTGLPPRKPDTGYRNTDYTFVDENDPVNITQSFVTAREKFRNEFDLAQIIDTRERRQIIGEIELSPLDFLADRKFPDTIIIARSNFDTHGFTTHPVFMTFPPDKKPLHARVPFRCLLPKKVEGVLVTGLGVSAHRDAIPVIRMQADVQNQGYAAGIAAATAAAKKCGFLDIPMRELQQQWVKCGILPESELDAEDSFPLDDNAILEAVRSGIKDHTSAAVILGNPQRSIPLLTKALGDAPEQVTRETAAILLGLMGETVGAELLMEWIKAESWDKGWNYTGMGQFGMSQSRLDTMIIALARTGDLRAVPLLNDKIKLLNSGSEFSHCRAVALAACCLRSPLLAESLANLIGQPGMSGHARTTLSDLVLNTPTDPEETASRNLSLRELALARGLRACGDANSLGQSILNDYSHDIRGHYVNHAMALLQEPVETTGIAPLEKRLEMA